MSLTLTKGSLQLEYVGHVNTIRLWEKEALLDVLVHNLVIIRAAV